MKNFKMSLVIAAFCIIFGCAANSFAQQPNYPVTGGWSSANVTDKEVIGAANYAVEAEAKKTSSKVKLVSIKCAERQVVAGMNYRVHLSVETLKRGKKTLLPQTVEAVVYRNLKQKYSLTTWKKGGCPTP